MGDVRKQAQSDKGVIYIQHSFYEAVYQMVAQVPWGSVATYGQIAWLCGRPRAGRIVGCAMKKAPSHLPCHRIVYKNGALCDDDCFGGPGIQRQLLEQEGIAFLPDGRVDMCKYLWNGMTKNKGKRSKA